MRTNRSRAVVSIAMVAVLGALGACADDGGGGSEAGGLEGSVPAAPNNAGAEAVQSPASTLRANLTGLLQQHVFLTGTWSAARLSGQDPAPAAAALDQNAVALSNVVGSVYGPGGGQEFLDLWRRQTDLLAVFTGAAGANDKAMLDKAKADLDSFVDDFATFVNTANPNLAKDAIAEDAETSIGDLQAAIVAQAKKDPLAADKLKDAADHTPETAAVLTAGIVKQHPKTFLGKADGAAATLRSVLTAKLEQHVYLAGLTTGAILASGDAKGPASVLEANSVELANVVGAAYGDARSRVFLTLWRRHVGFLLDYAEGRRTGDAAKVAEAVSDLDGYAVAFGTFMASANPNLSKDVVAADVEVHVDSLLAAIAAQASGDPGSVAGLDAAAQHMPATAALLSLGIASQFPGRFS